MWSNVKRFMLSPDVFVLMSSPFFPWNCFRALTFWSSPSWCLNPVEFEVGERWSRRWWWLFALLTLTSGTSCSALARGACVGAGVLGRAVEGLLAQIRLSFAPWQLLSAELELLMLPVMRTDGDCHLSWGSWRRRIIIISAPDLSESPELCSPFIFLSSSLNLIRR